MQGHLLHSENWHALKCYPTTSYCQSQSSCFVAGSSEGLLITHTCSVVIPNWSLAVQIHMFLCTHTFVHMHTCVLVGRSARIFLCLVNACSINMHHILVFFFLSPKQIASFKYIIWKHRTCDCSLCSRCSCYMSLLSMAFMTIYDKQHLLSNFLSQVEIAFM